MMPQLNKERDILTAHSEMCSKVISSVDELQYAALTTNESTLERIWTGEDEVEWEAALKIMCLVSWRNGGLRLVLWTKKLDLEVSFFQFLNLLEIIIEPHRKEYPDGFS